MCQSGYENYDPTINVSDRLSDNEYYAISKMKQKDPTVSTEKAKEIYYKNLTGDLEEY